MVCFFQDHDLFRGDARRPGLEGHFYPCRRVLPGPKAGLEYPGLDPDKVVCHIGHRDHCHFPAGVTVRAGALGATASFRDGLEGRRSRRHDPSNRHGVILFVPETDRRDRRDRARRPSEELYQQRYSCPGADHAGIDRDHFYAAIAFTRWWCHHPRQHLGRGKLFVPFGSESVS